MLHLQWFWRRDEKGVMAGYPVEMNRFWYGLPPSVDSVDAVYERAADGKIVFFKGWYKITQILNKLTLHTPNYCHIRSFVRLQNLFYYFFKKFMLDRGPFCVATGTLCFQLRITLPMSFKVRVDRLLPVLYCHLRPMIHKGNKNISPAWSPALKFQK